MFVNSLCSKLLLSWPSYWIKRGRAYSISELRRLELNELLIEVVFLIEVAWFTHREDIISICLLLNWHFIAVR